MIQFENVSHAFGNKTTVQNIGLSLDAGKTHVLLGLSGSGKSTLLKLILGSLIPRSGKISVDGLEVNDEHHSTLTDRIGYVVQEGGLFPHLSARQNITLVAGLRGWDKSKIQKRMDELLEMTQLESNLLDRRPSKLSGGQRQRVSLCRALFRDPQTLLLDEPLGALDPLTRHGLQFDLRNIFNLLKKTVILVTHDLSEAAYFGNTVTLLNDGGVIQHGPFRDLLDKPANEFVQSFVQAQRPIPEMQS